MDGRDGLRARVALKPPDDAQELDHDDDHQDVRKAEIHWRTLEPCRLTYRGRNRPAGDCRHGCASTLSTCAPRPAVGQRVGLRTATGTAPDRVAGVARW